MNTALRIILSAVGLIGTAVLAWLMFKRCLSPLRAQHAGYEPVTLRFRYTPDALLQSLTVLDADGRKLLARYWRLGLGFALCAWVAMLVAARNTAAIDAVSYSMHGAASLFMMFQLAEKGLLLRIVGKVPVKTSQMAPMLTTAKWIAFGLWVLGLFAGLFYTAARM